MEPSMLGFPSRSAWMRMNSKIPLARTCALNRTMTQLGTFPPTVKLLNERSTSTKAVEFVDCDRASTTNFEKGVLPQSSRACRADALGPGASPSAEARCCAAAGDAWAASANIKSAAEHVLLKVTIVHLLYITRVGHAVGDEYWGCCFAHIAPCQAICCIRPE